MTRKQVQAVLTLAWVAVVIIGIIALSYLETDK